MANEVLIASDHNGNSARAYVIKVLQREFPEVKVVDLGPNENGGKVDYPEMAENLAIGMIGRPNNRGILICGTGTGMCIVANRFPWIRAGLATDRATAELMREHNDCNVLVLGQWRSSLSEMDQMVRSFMTTPFGGGRHEPRLQRIAGIDPKRWIG